MITRLRAVRKKTFTKNAQSGNKKFGEKTDEFRTAAYRA